MDLALIDAAGAHDRSRVLLVDINAMAAAGNFQRGTSSERRRPLEWQHALYRFLSCTGQTRGWKLVAGAHAGVNPAAHPSFSLRVMADRANGGHRRHGGPHWFSAPFGSGKARCGPHGNFAARAGDGRATFWQDRAASKPGWRAKSDRAPTTCGRCRGRTGVGVMIGCASLRRTPAARPARCCRLASGVA